jgi:LysM repeat protein
MNKEFLSQLSPEDQSVSEVMQSQAQSIRVNPQFQSNLEARLKQAHPENKQPERSTGIKILPAIGWAILAIGAFLILNWAVSSLVPDRQPAANGTPDPEIPFESDVKSDNICAGQLAVAHGFSVFLTNQDKTGFVTVDEQKEIDELRTFSWSPDGQQLAIVGNTRGSGNLYLADSGGNPLKQVFTDSTFGYLAGVAWSHDGKQLLTWEINNNTRLFLVDIDGTGAAVLNLPVQFFETPQFTPDDKSIIFYGADASTDGLFQASIDGSQVTMISDQVKNESSFAWSPDGSRLAYIEMTGSGPSKAHLVIQNDSDKDAAVTYYQIQIGIGFSNHESANLSWSPDGENLVFEFRNASVAVVVLKNPDGGWMLSDSAHAPAISANGRCLAYIRNNQVFVLDLAAAASSSTYTAPVLLADLPVGRGSANFQLDKLQWGSETTSAPDIQINDNPIPTPSGTEYDWRGIKLYMNAALPDTPEQGSLFLVQPEQPATPDSARALASQFGLGGELYETPPELSNSSTPDFLVVDGNQRLRVRSNLYFSYYPDYTRWIATASTFSQVPDQAAAEEMIGAFLRSHGFDFAYKVEFSEFYTGYYALPLTPDGFTIQHQHFNFAGLLFRFDDAGVIAVEANLVDYTAVQTFGIIPAELALQKLLDPNTVNGILEGMHSGNRFVQTWNRSRPENQTITVWGWINSVKSVNGGAPLVTFDGYRATGNLEGLAESTPNTFVEATGQIQEVDGVKTFNIENWLAYKGYEDGLQGTIQRDGDRVMITNMDGNILTLPDIPADLPLPLENAFVLGVTQGDVFEWKSIDTRMQGGGGGGGGGGGSGFYKPNLTGTPVPLPTIQSPQETSARSGDYVVQEGDSLSAIAETYGITVDELMQANGLADATIFIGQSLVIPGAPPEQSPIGQTIDGQRGTITVTIVNKLDGSQQVEYTFQVIEENQYMLAKLEGNDLEALQAYNNHPIRVWGVIDHFEANVGWEMPVVNVERYEILYPDQHFKVFKGTQSVTTVEGQSVTLFTTDEGQVYAQPDTYAGIIGNEGDPILVEALVIPDETIAGYPILQIASASMAINPKSGQPAEMQVTADQPYVMDEAEQPEIPAELTATIESVKLVYFTPNQRYTALDPSGGPVYLQPAWRFQGHYWDGSEFEIMVQALKDEFLLPEIEAVEPPG